MTTIAKYLIGLSNNPAKLETFRSDPEGAVNRSRALTDEQKAVLLSGDAQRIQHVIEFESGLAPGSMIVCIVFKPGTPPPP